MQRNELVEQYLDVSHTFQLAWKNHFTQVLSSEQMSLAQVGLLMIIKTMQPISGSDLAAHMRISRSAVTQLIDALGQQGYIKRQEDVHDRRISYITLSGKGIAKYTALEKIRRELYMKLAGALDDDELRAIVSIHKKMIIELEKAGE